MNSTNNSRNEVSTAISLANPEIGQARRKILDLVNRLHNTGVQADIDLPQIAVIGIQSAGKSSLIESISGITLPRSSGTCTRCPTECRLSFSEKPWECIPSLRFTTDVKGQPLGQARNVPFGSPIYERSKVEERIRRAQRAILNPSRSPDEFLHETGEDDTRPELTFSTNCVTLKITGPDVTDLSFCDLPGLISSVGSGGSTDDIKLVENLVASYVKQPSCIILLTVACETDFENQGAHRLAKQFDPEGKRTVGVLTKPDRIPKGEESRWIPFIRNEKEPLRNGWYRVKQPSSDDLEQGMTWEGARKSEDDYFLKAPWSELDYTCQRFLRTSNLVQSLSMVLSDLISKRLPEIQEELENCIEKTALQLGKLPRASGDRPFEEIMELVHKFTMDVTRHINGVSEPDGLLQAIRPAQERFRLAIRRTAPNFIPFEEGSDGPTTVDAPDFLSEKDEESGSDDGKGHQDRRDKAISGQTTFDLDEVMMKAQQSRTRELPGNYPYVVQQEFIKETIRHWRTPTLRFCRLVYNAVLDHMKALMKAHFSSFGQGALEQRVSMIMQTLIKKCWERTEERILWLLELEESPSTLNAHYLLDYRNKFLAHYKAARAKRRYHGFKKYSHTAPVHPPTTQGNKRNAFVESPVTGSAKVIEGLLEMGITGIKPEDIPNLLPDPMEPALVIMAEVRAYFQVAYKRFADNVPNAIDVELIRGVEKDLMRKVSQGLGINGKDGLQICMELAKENPLTSNRREDLKKKLERLQVASQELLSISQ
ncbi:hypothetical protein M378DRAFT_199179 [Amanita muscaria Koide BX008]|uniref:Uncharacterized protein n=1 Tax=Amanita muscaria (strain Koide BX008) TaxID=946122 RepID=A0A0C2T7B2_AMAMK|nr:hypothetical protein M378DRAFT_199179 [Amanita muscaria Koide BX008]